MARSSPSTRTSTLWSGATAAIAGSLSSMHSGCSRRWVAGVVVLLLWVCCGFEGEWVFFGGFEKVVGCV